MAVFDEVFPCKGLGEFEDYADAGEVFEVFVSKIFSFWVDDSDSLGESVADFVVVSDDGVDFERV